MLVIVYSFFFYNLLISTGELVRLGPLKDAATDPAGFAGADERGERRRLSATGRNECLNLIVVLDLDG